VNQKSEGRVEIKQRRGGISNGKLGSPKKRASQDDLTLADGILEGGGEDGSEGV